MIGFRGCCAATRLSYCKAVMRRPTFAEVEFTILLFCVLAPMAYFMMRGLIALAS